jgi:hypothetical protein
MVNLLYCLNLITNYFDNMPHYQSLLHNLQPNYTNLVNLNSQISFIFVCIPVWLISQNLRIQKRYSVWIYSSRSCIRWRSTCVSISCFFPLFYWLHIWTIATLYRNFTSCLIEQTMRNVLKSCQWCGELIYLRFIWHKKVVRILFHTCLRAIDHNKVYFCERIVIKSKKKQLFL